ncbi:hypothetical protein HT031_003010 [Scenedesmus sp. PABB004]|nr:hypothetical protein HT031_003010 [Scenedesmus sp. PABB004]
MDVPPEALAQLEAVKCALDDLETHMTPFLEAAPRDLVAQLTPQERVRAHLALAQAVMVLFQLHRRLDGAALGEAHPAHKELERLAAYERKAKKALTADDLARTRPGASLNVAAANRFIDAAIPDLTPEQKAALRSMAQRVQEQAGERQQGQQGQQQQEQPAAPTAGGGKRKQAEGEPGGSGSDDASSDGGGGPVLAGQQQRRVQKRQRQRQRPAVAAGAAPDEAAGFLAEVLADAGGEGP